MVIVQNYDLLILIFFCMKIVQKIYIKVFGKQANVYDFDLMKQLKKSYSEI